MVQRNLLAGDVEQLGIEESDEQVIVEGFDLFFFIRFIFVLFKD